MARFSINDGIDGTYTLADMLEVNYHDDEFCTWARSAKVGDVWPGIGEKCECVADMSNIVRRHVHHVETRYGIASTQAKNAWRRVHLMYPQFTRNI